MTNRDKSKILNRNVNGEALKKLVQVKYDNNKLRIVAPVEEVKSGKVIVVQTGGYSESGLSKSRSESKKREENLRTLELDKIKTIREIKPVR